MPFMLILNNHTAGGLNIFNINFNLSREGEIYG